jgi:LacI family transcriptional regulator
MKTIPRVILWFEASRQAGRDMLKGLSNYTKLHGPWSFYRQLPFYQISSASSRIETRLQQIIREWQPDGIVIEGPPVKAPENLIPPNMPAVIIPTRNLVDGFCNVIDNDGNCGRLGAEHFLDRGFTNLAYCGYTQMYWSKVRAEAYCQRAHQAGLEVHTYDQPISKIRTWEKEKINMVNWLVGLPKPVAIMACNDDLTQYIFDACKTAELRIPEEIALLGVDNDDLICSLSDPLLSSIRLNFEKCGYEMAEMLHEQMMAQKPRHHSIALEAQHVVTRQSTDIMAIDNPDLVKALVFIRKHATNRIGIDHVVSQVSLSRRMLERHFRQYLGRSIHQEILRVQMHAIEKRLLETELPVSKIARNCGFSTPEYMGQAFRRYHKMTMRQYRKLHKHK